MAPTKQTAIRLDEELLARIDRHAKRLSQPGLPVTRTSAVRVLLIRALDAVEAEQKAPAARKRKR